ncbi:uncharacterized protein LOC106130423 [Amyelois transitella]|uniref:uncharacterized protein LOC106130423 n=1 Tax=Amyelois transitella TaxID=680683 RepID=UPI0029901B19|nr:uncharacterized protein LOC106130423 [Amyelois transitella]
MDIKKTKFSTFSSFNCQSLKRSIDCVRRVCKQSDIVSLQETWLLPHDINLLGTVCDEFEYTGKSAVDTSAGLLVGRPYGGVAILWRKGLFDSVNVLECDSNRLAAIRATMGNRTIIVISVYMPTDSIDNLPLFTEVLGEISAIEDANNAECIYLLGDFNAHICELFYRELCSFSADRSWICADVEKLGIDSNSYTFVSQVHGCKRWLDHFVVSQSAYQSVVDIRIEEGVYMSDHFPIFMTCNLEIVRQKLIKHDLPCGKITWGDRKESEISTYQHACNASLRDIQFPEEFVECSFGFCSQADHCKILDNLYEKIVCTLGDAAAKAKTPTQNQIKRGKVLCGWNKHVQDAHHEARLKFEVWVQHNRPTLGPVYEQMCEARKIFKSRLNWCQKNQEKIKMDLLASQRASNNFRDFWKATARLNVGPGRPASVDGKSDSVEIASMFREHFRVSSSVGHALNMCKKESILQLHFSAAEVKQAIGGMKGGKSPGHDGLSVEHLRHAGVHLPRVLSMFFSLCISHSYLPPDLMKTIVVPIVKNRTGDISDKNNYRPISLATIIAKVLDGVLDSRLEQYLNLHDAQFGFRPHLSTESAITVLKNTIQYYTSRKTPVHGCFLDFSRAFDRVSYEVLWRKLEARNVPAEICNIFKFWYQNQINVVKWSDGISDAYRLECGVRQGGITSPKLFNLYVNDLIVGLSSMRVGCSIDGVVINNISYADDMVLLGPTTKSINEMLRVCESFAAEHGLVYNVEKCVCMVFGVVGKCPRNTPPMFLSGKELKIVKTFKYLGHVLADDLKDDDDIERERRALAVRGNMLARRFARCSDQVKITLFKAFCQGFYTGGLWVRGTKRSLDALRIQYNNIFRMLLRLPKFCSASEMFAQTRTDGFHAVIRKKMASLIRRIRSSGNTILRTVADRYDSPIIRHLVRGTMPVALHGQL